MGKKGLVAALMSELKNIPNEEKKEFGQVVNVIKQEIEEEITAKEKEAVDLRNKYFGQDGELSKKRQSLLKPIQDDVYNAVKKVSEEKGYQVIFDRASSASIVFASPRIDVSNEVLAKLGYSK